MNACGLKRVMVGFALMVFVFSAAGQPVSAAPPAPVPISPAAGSSVAVPAFGWAAAAGAVKYELEVGPQSDPLAVLWTAQTPNLSITPVDAAAFINSQLYWRVRAYDAANQPGPWSEKINFTKHIPAPGLVSPLDGQTIHSLGFEWSPAAGAVSYRIELADSASFTHIVAEYSTYNTSYNAVTTLPVGETYWRVTGLDAEDHPGTPSTARVFSLVINPPTVTHPINGMALVIPAYAWQATAGAASYQVELSTSSSMIPVSETYTTCNYLLIPNATIENGSWYARVKGVDADGHIGAQGSLAAFSKNINTPTLLNPPDNAAVTTPSLQWQAVEGAAYYKVELSTSPTFIPIENTYTTYNLQITPADSLPAGDHYWRVTGMDNDDHPGASSSPRKFTLNSPPAPSDTIPQLLTPAAAQTLTADPDFSWTRVAGASDYHLIVSQYADFHANYDAPYLDYPAYTPSDEGSHDAYANGTYYWKVQARNGTTVIATSEARSFTKAQPIHFVQPDDASTVPVDPNFEWEHFVGADRYRVLVSQEADFDPLYDSIYTDYRGYTPYTPGSHDTYINGTYYWKVQALNASGSKLAESPARTFTKETQVQLYSPADGDTTLTADPLFWWRYVPCAERYHLVVSKFANFSPVYDSVYTDYPAYSPSPEGDHPAYPNGSYYWKVEALNGTAKVSTSPVRSFAKNAALGLLGPGNGSGGNPPGPAFTWEAFPGADHYRLLVSSSASFTVTYDSVSSEYPGYTPYSAGVHSQYADGTYYWKVEAYNGSSLLLTSNTWSFSVGTRLATYLPVIRR